MIQVKFIAAFDGCGSTIELVNVGFGWSHTKVFKPSALLLLRKLCWSSTKKRQRTEWRSKGVGRLVPIGCFGLSFDWLPALCAPLGRIMPSRTTGTRPWRSATKRTRPASATWPSDAAANASGPAPKIFRSPVVAPTSTHRSVLISSFVLFCFHYVSSFVFVCQHRGNAFKLADDEVIHFLSLW